MLRSQKRTTRQRLRKSVRWRIQMRLWRWKGRELHVREFLFESRPRNGAVHYLFFSSLFLLLCLLKQTIKGLESDLVKQRLSEVDPIRPLNVAEGQGGGARGGWWGSESFYIAKPVSTYHDKLGVRKHVKPIWKAQKMNGCWPRCVQNVDGPPPRFRELCTVDKN